MTIRACLRISVNAPESQSLDQQRHLITRWAEYKHPDEPIEWYVDPGVSGGKPLAERPEGGRLLRELAPGDKLAVTKIDRVARNVTDFLATLNHCEAVGAKFVATEQDVSTEGAYGKFMLVLLGALAELERGIVRERTLAARAQFLRDGRHGVGILPFGFHAVPHPERGWLVVRPRPDEGPALAQAIQNILAGASLASQARALGVKLVAFQRLMRNPRLYGQTPGGVLDPEAGVISASTFQALQKHLGQSERTWTRTDGLGPALLCWRCDSRLYLDTSQGRYRCESKEHGQRPTISRETADDFLLGEYLGRYGSAPVIFVTTDQADDDGAAGELDAMIEQTAKLMATASSDQLPIYYQQLQELRTQREAAQAAPTKTTTTMSTDGTTVRDLLDKAGPNERVSLITAGLRAVVHPASRPGGRLEVTPSEPVSEPVLIRLTSARMMWFMSRADAIREDFPEELFRPEGGRVTFDSAGRYEPSTAVPVVSSAD